MALCPHHLTRQCLRRSSLQAISKLSSPIISNKNDAKNVVHIKSNIKAKKTAGVEGENEINNSKPTNKQRNAMIRHKDAALQHTALDILRAKKSCKQARTLIGECRPETPVNRRRTWTASGSRPFHKYRLCSLLRWTLHSFAIQCGIFYMCTCETTAPKLPT